jgi:hypothetical protein
MLGNLIGAFLVLVIGLTLVPEEPEQRPKKPHEPRNYLEYVKERLKVEEMLRGRN